MKYYATDKRGSQYKNMAGQTLMAFKNGVPLKDPDVDDLMVQKRTAEGTPVFDEKDEPVMVLRYGFVAEEEKRGRPAQSANKVLKDKAKSRRGDAVEALKAIS